MASLNDPPFLTIRNESSRAFDPRPELQHSGSTKSRIGLETLAKGLDESACVRARWHDPTIATAVSRRAINLATVLTPMLALEISIDGTSNSTWNNPRPSNLTCLVGQWLPVAMAARDYAPQSPTVSSSHATTMEQGPAHYFSCHLYGCRGRTLFSTRLPCTEFCQIHSLFRSCPQPLPRHLFPGYWKLMLLRLLLCMFL